MRSIWKRELQCYFFTPVGYVFMGIFLLLSSIMFYVSILMKGSCELPAFIGSMSHLWMLLCPVLTMRLLAEEKQKRTDQLLLTSPVSLPAVVMGKYLAAVTVMLLTTALTLPFVAIVAIYGQVYPSELAVGYLGFILQGCALLAVDLFLSGCAGNQVTAVVMAFGANFLLWLMELLETAVNNGLIRELLSFFSLYARSRYFIIGQLSFAGVGYFLSFAAAFIALTIHVLDSRRYRGA